MADLVLWLGMAVVYAFGGGLMVGLKIAETKRGGEQWPWWTYPIVFVFWWPIMAVAVVRNFAKQVKS